MENQNKAVAVAINGTANNANAVATYTPTINLPVLTDRNFVLEVIQENLEGLGALRFPKVSIPGAGGLSFTVVDAETGDETAATSITGVLLGKHAFKVWYQKSFEEKGGDDDEIVMCISVDCETGSGCQDPVTGDWLVPFGQKCETCQYNQWESSRKGGRGKDCSDKFRLHIAQEGEVFPIRIDLPPTSLSNFKDYLKRLTNKAKPYYGVVTQIKLETDKNDSGTKFSKATFSKVNDLSREEFVAIKEYMQAMASSMAMITRESLSEPAPVGTTVDAEGGASDDEEEAY